MKRALETIIRTDLKYRGLTMHPDEITSLVKEVMEHRRWYGRDLTTDEVVTAVRAGIEKMARPFHAEGGVSE